MHVAAGAYFFLIGFAVGFLLAEADLPFVGMPGFFVAELAGLRFGGALGPDFDSVVALDFVAGFATFLEEDTAGFVACGDFSGGVAVLACAADFTGATDLDGIAGTDFFPASTFSGAETCFAAGGLLGFLFGGNWSSAKRSITSAMLCSVSA